MLNQIEFLKDEIKSKNKVIEILCEDRLLRANPSHTFTNVETDARNSDAFFTVPKRSVKLKTVKSSLNTIDLTNSYNPLLTLNDDNQILERDRNSNVTFRKNESNVRNLKDVNVKNSAGKYQGEKDVQEREHREKVNEKPVIAVVGDSIVKGINGYKLSSDKTRVVVKSFSGATTQCMKYHIQPSLTHNPETLIIHCGTNNLKKDEQPEEIANNILKLALEAATKCPETSIIVSSLLSRKDKHHNKAMAVNNCLKELCNSRNMGYIDHSNINTSHLNKSKIHLTISGTTILSRNILLAAEN